MEERKNSGAQTEGWNTDVIGRRLGFKLRCLMMSPPSTHTLPSKQSWEEEASGY